MAPLLEPVSPMVDGGGVQRGMMNFFLDGSVRGLLDLSHCINMALILEYWNRSRARISARRETKEW